MNTQKKQHSIAISYCEAQAYSLIQFAKKNESFSDWLQSMFSNKQTSFPMMKNISNIPVLPTINDEQHAIRKTLWLIELGESEDYIHTQPALQLLTEWANIREREDPKAIVLGLVIGIEPFGLFGEAKRKHHPIDIIVRDNVLKNIKKTTLAKMSVTLANEIVQKALIEVKGNANLLEPDLSDWFFGDKTIVFYSADEETLYSIEHAVREIDAPYASRADKQSTTFFAVGPTLYINDFTESDKLEELI